MIMITLALAFYSSVGAFLATHLCHYQCHFCLYEYTKDFRALSASSVCDVCSRYSVDVSLHSRDDSEDAHPWHSQGECSKILFLVIFAQNINFYPLILNKFLGSLPRELNVFPVILMKSVSDCSIIFQFWIYSFDLNPTDLNSSCLQVMFMIRVLVSSAIVSSFKKKTTPFTPSFIVYECVGTHMCTHGYMREKTNITSLGSYLYLSLGSYLYLRSAKGSEILQSYQQQLCSCY